MLKSHIQTLNQPHAKHPVERMVEDIVRSANRNSSDEEQTEIYNNLMISLFHIFSFSSCYFPFYNQLICLILLL